MIKLTTFCDDRMTISASLCAKSAMKFGATEYSIWTPRDLDPAFRETMHYVLRQERGAGFYAWKPYVCQMEMMRLNDGDILVWCDAGNEWIGDMNRAVAAMDQDILFFDNGWKHAEWCKMDCLSSILPNVERQIKEGARGLHLQAEAHQVQASTFFIRVTPETRKFVQEWFAWSLMPGMIDNEPSVLPNVPGFQEHRWDQSILTCLQIKYGYRLHWFPSHTNLHRENSQKEYPVLFNHHRRRNIDWK